MNYPLLTRTLRHLKPTQVAFQLLNRMRKSRFKFVKTPIKEEPLNLAFWCEKPISFFVTPNRAGSNDFVTTLNFLNLSHTPKNWNDASHGMLWAYNLNYMDYLLQPNLSFKDGLHLIEKFIEELPSNKVGLDPYPIALRGINWIKWLSLNKDQIDKSSLNRVHDSLYSQYRLLQRKLEYHLLGNHLLEDAYSLTIGAIYFGDRPMWSKASKLLLRQLKEQTLSDGAHYEQSPMYHCILLDRLLDVYNISVNNNRFGRDQELLSAKLGEYARLMLGHLESIVWSDGSIPLLNDSAYGIAPTPKEIFNYASSLGLKWNPIPLGSSGYRKLRLKHLEAIVDIGNITASYQPGHTHADTFNYELRIDGRPFVIDTGISTYNKTSRRQYERSTQAHNTVTVNNKDTSEVWGGFRLGRRAKVTVLNDTENMIVASHDGISNNVHTRKFEIHDGAFVITDELSEEAKFISRIHFAPGVEVRVENDKLIETSLGKIEIIGATSIYIVDQTASKEYNKFENIKVAEISFTKSLVCRFVIDAI